jgi:hypothetical protein
MSLLNKTLIRPIRQLLEGLKKTSTSINDYLTIVHAYLLLELVIFHSNSYGLNLIEFEFLNYDLINTNYLF